MKTPFIVQLCQARWILARPARRDEGKIRWAKRIVRLPAASLGSLGYMSLREITDRASRSR